MKLTFISTVTLGYGNPEYLNLLRALSTKIPDLVIQSIEPIDHERPYYKLPDLNIIRPEKSFAISHRLKKTHKFGILCCKALSKFSFTVQLLNILLDKSPSVLVTSKYHPLLAFLPRNCKLHFYCSELFEISNKRGFFFYKFKKKVSSIVCPQIDRMRIAREIFNCESYYLIQNCPPRNKQSNHSRKNTHTILYQGRVSRLSSARQMLDFAYSLPPKYRMHIAGPIDPEFKNEILNLSRQGRITYHGYLTALELARLRSTMAFGLVTWGNLDLNTMYCAPNKLYEYISEGMVVLALNNHSMHQLNSQYSFGKVSSSDHEELINYITELDDYEKISRRNLQTHLEELNFEHQASQFVQDIANEIIISGG